MKVDWLWDKKLTLAEVKDILKDESNERFVDIASTLLSRKNNPKEVFEEYVDKIDFAKNWPKIKRRMRKDKWNNPRITFWQAVYEKLLAIYSEKGIKVRLSGALPDSELCEYIGDQVKKIREEMKLTQNALADKMGISQQIISRIERGRENISLKTLERIIEALRKEISIDFSIDKPDSSQFNGLDSIVFKDKSHAKENFKIKVFSSIADDNSSLGVINGTS